MGGPGLLHGPGPRAGPRLDWGFSRGPGVLAFAPHAAAFGTDGYPPGAADAFGAPASVRYCSSFR